MPRNIQEALSDSNWRLVVFEEMNALKKNDTWEMVELSKGKKGYGANGCLLSRVRQTGVSRDTKLVLLQKVLLKPME